MSTLQTHAHQWALAEGVRKVHSELMVVRTAAPYASNTRKGQLFVVVEPVDNAVHGREACAIVARTLSTTLYTDRSASITSSLRRAFAAAHQALCAHNRRVPPAERALVGASCAVVHGDTLYLAQVQPSQAFIIQTGHTRAIPSLDLYAPLLNHQHALGNPLCTAPELAYINLAAGDKLVLCSASVAQHLTPQQAQTLLQHGDANAIADQLYQRCAAAGVYEAQAMVIGWQGAAVPGDAADVSTGTTRPHAHKQPPVPAPHEGQALAREQPLPPTGTGAMTARTNKDADHRGKRPTTDGTRREHATLNDSRMPTQNRQRGTAQRTPARQQSQRVTAPTQRHMQVPTRHGASKPRLPMRWLPMLLLVSVVALLGVGVQQINQRPARLASAALARVDQSLAAATGASNQVNAQQELANAATALRVEVEPLVQTGVITDSQPAIWQQYQQVLGRYDQAMVAINHVGFVDQLQPVAALPGGQGLIGRVVLGTGAPPNLFYLDRSNGRLFQAGQAAPVLQSNAMVGNTPVAQLRDALWRDGELLVFERGAPPAPAYRLLYRDGNQWVAIPLARTETMAPLDGDLPMATFGGHVYVWDRDLRQLWQYTGGQLSAPPVASITDAGGVPLDKVVDVAVDGRIYLLNSDGSMLVLENGRLVRQLPAPQLATPINTVVRFVVTPDTVAADGSRRPGAIYVLDTQNERVLQIDKSTGALIQQIQARRRGVLNQLTDLAVDEAQHTLYLADGAQVLKTPLLLPAHVGPNASPDPGAPK